MVDFSLQGIKISQCNVPQSEKYPTANPKTNTNLNQSLTLTKKHVLPLECNSLLCGDQLFVLKWEFSLPNARDYHASTLHSNVSDGYKPWTHKTEKISVTH